jgi:colanic acid biosynthesis glycosyl transferase WcaI
VCFKHIIFVNRFFYPDESATSQILSDLAFALAERGFTVTVIASAAGVPCRSSFSETIRGVEVLRIPTGGVCSRDLVPRSLEYLKFYFNATRLLFGKTRRENILIAKTDPPLISFFVALVARLRRAVLINWLQDIYPEVAYELGVPLMGGPIGWGLKRARHFALRSARVNVAIGHQMAAFLREICGGSGQIEIIPNWVDDDKIRALSPTDNPFLNKIAKNGEFIVGYSGNLGRAHEFKTLFGAAQILRRHKDVIFAFIGGGYCLNALKANVVAAGIGKQFRFLAAQPVENLPFSLPAPNVHWISLRPQLEGLILPSKFYGILAAGRPMIAIMAKTGEVSREIERFGCGIVIEPGDSERLACEILRLKDDGVECAIMGRRARELLEQKYQRKRSINRWIELLQRL